MQAKENSINAADSLLLPEDEGYEGEPPLVAGPLMCRSAWLQCSRNRATYTYGIRLSVV